MQTLGNIEVRVERGVKLTPETKCGYCNQQKMLSIHYPED